MAPVVEPSGPSRGSAHKARERKKRATAHKVAWLASLCQAAGAHHTARSGGGSQRPVGVEELGKQVVALSSQVARLQAQVAALTVQLSTARMTDEQAYVAGKLQKEEKMEGSALPVPWAWPVEPPVVPPEAAVPADAYKDMCKKEEYHDSERGQGPVAEPVAGGGEEPLAHDWHLHVSRPGVPHADSTHAGGHLRGDVPSEHLQVEADHGAPLRDDVEGAGWRAAVAEAKATDLGMSSGTFIVRHSRQAGASSADSCMHPDSFVAEDQGQAAGAHGHLRDRVSGYDHVDELHEDGRHSTAQEEALCLDPVCGPAESGQDEEPLRGEVQERPSELAEVQSAIEALLANEHLAPAQHKRLQALLRREEELENL